MIRKDSCPYCKRTECEHLFYVREGEIGRIYGLVKIREKKFLNTLERYLQGLNKRGQIHITEENGNLWVYSEKSRWEIIEGFKDIVESDFCNPPNFTLYPNPYVKEFVQKHLMDKPYNPDEDDYYREPYVSDMKEGKNTPLYNAHTFHTKVPPQAIERFIEHYTHPGDLVLDSFSGSGMTGVAALRRKRKAILIELSPIANFIASNYCTTVNIEKLEREASHMMMFLEKEIGFFYSTRCRVCGGDARIEYTIWSDVSRHVLCGHEFLLWDTAVNVSRPEVISAIKCPNCQLEVKKTDLKRVMIKPVRINYTCISGKHPRDQDRRREDDISSADLELITRIDQMWSNSKSKELVYPIEAFLFKGPRWGDTWRAGVHEGMVDVPDFFTPRNIWTLSSLWREIFRVQDNEIRQKLTWTFTGLCTLASRFTRYNFRKRGNGPISGTLYVPSFHAEQNVIQLFHSKFSDIKRALPFIHRGSTIVSTQSATDLANVPDNSIDYVFIDPPYGANLMYSELDFLWESWLGWFTDTKDEAIINDDQGKNTAKYKELMLAAFNEIYRVMKPRRYLTLAFNNSNPEIWNAIRDALKEAGFAVVSQHIFDNKQRTFKALKYGKVLKGYVIINCVKPLKPVVRATVNGRIAEENALEFVTERLGDLPLTLSPARTADSLWGDLAGKAVRLGYYLELDSLEFKQMLEKEAQSGRLKAVEAENERYYYLPTQEPPTQLKLIAIRNEEEAIEWLQDFLSEPKASGEIAPRFNASLHPEARLDLIRLLEDSFALVGDKWRKPMDKSEEDNIKKQAYERRAKEFEKWMKEILSDPGAKILSLPELRWGFRYLLDVSRYNDIVRLFQYLKDEQKRDRELKKDCARARAMVARYAREKEAGEQERLLRFLR